MSRPSTFVLRDGSQILVRPVVPEDRELIVDGFSRLSPESRYRRFFSPVTHLTGRQLDYLTRVDHHDHEALLAIDEETGQGVAVARYVRTGHDVAEPAIAVVDDWHGRGVASRLLDELVHRAREEGVRSFVAPVLAENAEAMAVLERLGPTTATHSGREVELTIDLTEPAEAIPSVHDLLRAVAAGTLDPVLRFWHRLVPRRRPPGETLADVVVVGLGPDGDDEAALATAEAVATALGAEVQLVGAQRPLLDDRDALDDRLRYAAARLERAGLGVEVQLRRGDLAAVLLDVAIEEHARMIVVPDAAATGVPGRLLGATWDHVSHHAPCDVLIARPPRG